MNKRSITDIHRLRAKGYSNRFLKYLRYDPALVENASKGAYDILPLITSETTRDDVLSLGYAPGAVDYALKLAGRSETPVKPKRTTKDLIRHCKGGVRLLKKR